MKRTLLTALLPLAATSLVVAGGATTSGAADKETNGRCALPTAERSYTRDMLVYRLTMDLTNCDWWDGSPVQLDATVERVDPSGGHGVGSLVMCGAVTLRDSTTASDEESALPTPEGDDGASTATATHEESSEQAGSTSPLRSGICAVEVSVEHPSPEAAHYTGEITFPRQGERRSVSFNALCGGNAAGCVDLPLNPMTTLAPIGHAIAGIGGDANAG